MIAGKKNSIEDCILDILKNGSMTTVDLIEAIKKKRPKTTKQGVYQVLRNMTKEEIVLIHKKKVSLNIRWLNKLNEFSAIAQHYYFQTNFGIGQFLNLREGEKIKYTFKNLSLTDAFWNHALYMLLETVNKDENWFSYNHHSWFFLARPEEEKALMKTIIKTRQYLLTVGPNQAMDKIINREFDNNKSQY